jgi:hypothetical protein
MSNAPDRIRPGSLWTLLGRDEHHGSCAIQRVVRERILCRNEYNFQNVVIHEDAGANAIQMPVLRLERVSSANDEDVRTFSPSTRSHRALQLRDGADLQVFDATFSGNGSKPAFQLHSADLVGTKHTDKMVFIFREREIQALTGQLPDKILPLRAGLVRSHSSSFLVFRFPGGCRIGGYCPTGLGRLPSRMACDLSVSKRHLPHTAGAEV